VWIGRVLVNDLIEIEESRLGNSLFAEGVEAFKWRVGKDPGGADSYCSWGGGDRAVGDITENSRGGLEMRAVVRAVKRSCSSKDSYRRHG
jgi:hypothetical protein